MEYLITSNVWRLSCLWAGCGDGLLVDGLLGSIVDAWWSVLCLSCFKLRGGFELETDPNSNRSYLLFGTFRDVWVGIGLAVIVLVGLSLTLFDIRRGKTAVPVARR